MRLGRSGVIDVEIHGVEQVGNFSAQTGTLAVVKGCIRNNNGEGVDPFINPQTINRFRDVALPGLSSGVRFRLY